MDKVGLALENFDHLGKFRTVEKSDKSCNIDNSGYADEIGNFRGLAGFAQSLYKEKKTIENCLVEKKLLFTFGFDTKNVHPKYLKEMQRKFAAHGNYKQLVKDIILSTEFQSIAWK